MRGRGWQPSFPIGATSTAPGIPLVSASRWDTGASAVWRHGLLDVAAALTRGSPAIPVVEDGNDGLMWSGRTAARLPVGLTLGLSGARGQWLSNSVLDLTPQGRATPSSQSLVGADAEFGYGPWLLRGEWMRAVFETPIVLSPDHPDASLTAWSGFVEARYRPFPRWQVGARVERLAFGRLPGSSAATWDADVDRIEAVAGFRVSRRIEVRGGWQHNWRDGGRIRDRGLPVLAILGWF
jgi:hypothetical protein